MTDAQRRLLTDIANGKKFKLIHRGDCVLCISLNHRIPRKKAKTQMILGLFAKSLLTLKNHCFEITDAGRKALAEESGE